MEKQRTRAKQAPKRLTTIRMSETARRLRERIAHELGVSQTAAYEMAIRFYADSLGIAMDTPQDPPG